MIRLLHLLVRLGWPIRVLDPLFGRFNPLHPDHLRDPYPRYHALRTAAPVYYHPLLRVWFLTRYEDAVRVLRGPDFSVDRSQLKAVKFYARSLEPDFLEMIRSNLLMLDPPQHTRLRNLVNRAFTPRAVEQLRPRIQARVDALLDRAEDAGQLELVRDFAAPLPIDVIAELLGVPTEDRAQLKRWSDDLTALVDPITAPGGLQTAQAAFSEFAPYMREIAGARRREPQDDLISGLTELGDTELVSLAALILGAGHETTTNLLGNAVLALLRHPDERKRLQDDPSLIEGAVEEFLRYDSPVQLTDRVAARNCEIGGRPIRAGQLVAVLLGAANRDPERFPDPDRLDLSRPDNAHLAFGQGAHFCLGAQLARVETQIALGTLLRRFPRLEGSPEPALRVPSMVLRGPTALPLSLR